MKSNEYTNYRSYKRGERMRIRDKSRELEFFQQNYPLPNTVSLERQDIPEETLKSRIWRFIRANPKIAIQFILVIVVLAAERIKLDRKMNDASQAIEKMRGIADILTGTIESVRSAAEAPAKIGQVLNL